MMRQLAHSRMLGEADDHLLRALARYYYLTAEQVCRLFYAAGSLNYARERLRRLAEEEYAHRVLLPRPAERGGASPIVYTLARKGRQFLEANGVTLLGRYRPAEVQESYLHLQHTLDVNDVLIELALLKWLGRTRVELARVLHERDLKRAPSYVQLADGSRFPVIPDGWLELHLRPEQAAAFRVCLALELDRGTVEKNRWRTRVEAFLCWMKGPYQEAYKTKSLTIMVVTTDGAKRLADLLRWTESELTERQAQASANLFRFTTEKDAAGQPTLPQWRRPFTSTPLSLFEVEKGGA